MLVQCDGETLRLLPSLPAEWKGGEISGIKTRGNYQVDLVWKDGKVATARITAKNDGKLSVSYNGKTVDLSFKAGETKTVK